jgi:hypothetical protein
MIVGTIILVREDDVPMSSTIYIVGIVYGEYCSVYI